MTSRSTPCPDPQINTSEGGAGVTRCCSPRLHPQIEAAEEGAEMSCRRDGNSPAAPASLPDDEDMLREILLRLPPQPSSLPPASAVCRRWRRLVTDPKFLCSFRAHHRKPPLLGVFQNSNHGIVFKPILVPPDRVPPQRFDLGRYSHSYGYDVLCCRHGRVLVRDSVRKEVVVCDPITGEQRCVAIPLEFKRVYFNGAVLCAAVDHGHVHYGCHWSPFKVVLVSMYTNHERLFACVYSSETGLWGNLIVTEVPCEVSDKPAVLVGNCLYWLSLNDAILEFDLDENSLTVMRGPPVKNNISNGNREIIRAEDGAVGYATSSYPCFHMWQRNVIGHGVATWMPWKTIEMHTVLGLPFQIKLGCQQLIGYGEDVDVLFLLAGYGAYMVQLKSMQSRKLYETKSLTRCHPFTSFYTPGTAINGGSNGSEMLHDTLDARVV